MELGEFNAGLEFVGDPAKSLAMSRLNSSIIDLTRESDVLNQRQGSQTQVASDVPELTGKGVNVDLIV